MTSGTPALAAILTLGLFGASEAPSAPNEFKLVLRCFDEKPTPLYTVELIVRNHVAYCFDSDSDDEVILIEPAQSRVVLIDLERKIQTEISAKQLDAHIGSVYTRSLAKVERHDKKGERADKIAASMGRDLIDPRFKVVKNAAKPTMTLNNPSVQVDALLAEEPDQDRLIMIMNCLAALEKLDDLRDPDPIPPFTRLTALRTVAETGKTRPTEMSYLYRLAGRPRKIRKTYTLMPEISDRERNAILKLESIRKHTPAVGLADYEEADEGK